MKFKEEVLEKKTSGCVSVKEMRKSERLIGKVCHHTSREKNWKFKAKKSIPE